jgi:hypothetical protein
MASPLLAAAALTALTLHRYVGPDDSTNIHRTQMTLFRNARAILTDSHFLVPLVVFCVGLALLITLH